MFFGKINVVVRILQASVRSDMDWIYAHHPGDGSWRSIPVGKFFFHVIMHNINNWIRLH